MNRYELHQLVKEAEEKGRKAGFEEGRKQAPFRPSLIPGLGLGHPLPMPAGKPLPNTVGGKYRCRVEFGQCQHMAAYEIRATLFVGAKYYNAVDRLAYQTFEQLRVDGHLPRYLNRWLDGAYVAMWKEFKKDVIFELPPQFEAGDDRNIDPYW